MLDELKALKLLLGSATILISFYRIDPIPVEAANLFLKEYIDDTLYIYQIFIFNI